MALALIDADSIYFRAAFVSKKKNDIRKIINETMKDIEKELMVYHFDGIQMMVAVKGRDNFRNAIYPLYKANRKEQDKEMKKALNYGHTYMVEQWNAVMADGMEADDLVSIWAHEARQAKISYTIVGIDKDLLQIPGFHYNFKKRTHDVVGEEQGFRMLMQQCLTGDTADNIPGIRGIGPKKAAKILNNIRNDRLWNRVRAAWRAHSAGDPALSRRLLEMLKSWEEYEDLKAQITGETDKREPDVLQEQEENQ